MIALLLRSARQARYVVLAVFVLLCALQIIIVGQAAEIQRTQAFGGMANLVPAFLQRGLGNKALLLATFKGTVAFGYFHPLICVLIAGLGMYLATEPAHEIESGLVDLELARSLPRHRLVTRSLALASVTILAAVTLMFAGTFTGERVFDTTGLDMPPPEMRLRLLANLLAVGLCFSGFALWLGTASRRWMTAFSTAILTALVLYLVDFLAIGWWPMRAFAWLSPFHYYPALSIIAGDAPTASNIAVLLAAGAAFTGAAYWQFQRRDV